MKKRNRGFLLSAGTAFVLLLAARAPASAALDCDGLTAETLGLENAEIVSAAAVPKGDDSPAAHCLIEATTAERTGIDGQPYAVRFEMRLPDDWNGRFFHQFNGGNDGEVKPALGPLLSGNTSRTALGIGYAVLSSNAGHDGKAQSETGLVSGNRFGLDPEARAFYGYRAVEVLTPIAKTLIASYYGRPPQRSYGVGCSNGGRHGFVAAERLAEAYDGILAGAPGFNLPKAAVQHALDVQAFSAIKGDMRIAFTPGDLHHVANGIRAACDELDGVKDGMVLDSRACQAAFDVAALQCAPGQNTSCLSAKQVEALKTVHAGPINGEGEQLYSDWSWDTGIAGGNWRFWKVESTVPPWANMPIIAIMGAGSLAHVFTTPPTEVEGAPAALEEFLLDFDLDRDAPKIYASEDPFTESAMDIMTPPGADDPMLADFKAAGGKMIVFHGVSDPVFSANDTANWYEKLAENNGGSAADFVKYYPVPGMTHCAGGPATDDFNLFAALVDWVEYGIEPKAVIAGLTPDNKDIPAGWSMERRRPLCPWPQVARYQDGDVNQASSFACQD
ncbi:tannase/feruloyl esterase family alpha/beta hydrolase [Mesorhizobium xinjiangense]|uniref:tannase/feruloyl esterase family alpha/beta hydrolase n=1 Tax=Mesorhizobium xinjiangense TaxID=2678685 RepID=UPI0012ED8A4E|nr:tannase/feruloyl esterase family alpha/beta hydrolase [Mesorhizobium xinjiangense]